MSTSTSLLSPVPPGPRTLVICFDGTNSLYGGKNTNVVKFFALLEKELSDKQLVYYQAGIGTYTNPAMFTPIINFVARMMDEAVAWYLDAHVLSGYQFLMQNYKAGDKICISGFSRGAYTARALAGMLTKVGLMPPNMPEQLSFAYQMYKGTSSRNPQLRTTVSDTDTDSVRETLDALAPIDDQLKNPLWWILELLPVINSYQDAKGKWHWRILINAFRSRKIRGDILLHDSVKTREDVSNGQYKPKATWTGRCRWVHTRLQKSTAEDEV